MDETNVRGMDSLLQSGIQSGIQIAAFGYVSRTN